MEKKSKIIIGVVAIILVVIVASFLVLSNMEKTLSTENVAVTLPGSYNVDGDFAATSGDISVMFSPVEDSKDNQLKWLNTIKSKGKASGYENATNKTINGFTVYEFAAHPSDLKNVSSDKTYSGTSSSWSATWVTYPPYQPGELKYCDHYRLVAYIKGNTVTYLVFYTSNPNVDLYSPEINDIVASVHDPRQS